MDDKFTQVLNTADHDLLIKIAERLEGLVTTCNNLTLSLSKKADAGDIVNWRGDHEARIRLLEQSKWQLVGAFVALQIVGGLVMHYWK
jgi:hypothetical protein